MAIKNVIKKWKDFSPEDATSKSNWEEGWKHLHSDVVKVHDSEHIIKGISIVGGAEEKFIMNGTSGSWVEMGKVVLSQDIPEYTLIRTSELEKRGEPRQIVASFSIL